MATMVTTMADLDMSKDFDYSRWYRTMDKKWKDTAHSTHSLKTMDRMIILFLSAEAMDRLLQCATHALPYFSASVRTFSNNLHSCFFGGKSHAAG